MILHPKVVELVRERGWRGLNEIQVEASEYIAKGYNVLIVAPTGYGKTEAAVLPIMSRILYEGAKPIAVVYVTPLRALINDITRRLREWGDRLGIVVARRHSDISKAEKKLRMKRVPHIIVITPEGLEIELDWAHKFRRFYRNVRWVVIDEVHDLVGTKRGAQLALLISRLRAFTGRDLQIVMLSATVGNPPAIARYFVGSSKRPLKIITSSARKPMEVTLRLVDEDWESMAKAVAELMEPPTIVFVNSRYFGERLREELERLGIRNVMVHHSSVSKELREESERLLKEGRVAGVIATKTLELGIDVGYVKKVVVMGSPAQVQTFLQRIGRSGHTMGEAMRGAVIVWHPVQLLEALALLHLAEQGVLEEPDTGYAPLDVVARMLVGSLLKSEPVRLEELYEIVRGSGPYSSMSREEFSRLVELLRRGRLLEVADGRVRAGPRFYTIWRFEHERRWGGHGFTEFFTFISSLPEFVVRTSDGREVGKLDAHYVFRYLRSDDVIRLAGRSWRVVRIDDRLYTVEVEEGGEGGEVPLWRGDTARRSGIVAKEMARLLEEVCRGALRVPFAEVLKAVADRYLSEVGAHPSASVVIRERVNGYTVYTLLADERVVEALGLMLLYRLSSEEGLGVEVKTSHVGLAVKTGHPDPLSMLLSLSRVELEELALESVKRSPYFRMKLRELAPSFGVRDDDEDLAVEALRQLQHEYYDFVGALRLLEGIRSGEIRVVDAGERSSPLPFAEYILRLPPQRPWVHDVYKLIASYITDDAFTVNELSEMLALPARYIENKLKEMRKGRYRATYFIDVDSFEKRWVLAGSLPSIAKRFEYSDSFSFEETGEALKVMVRRSSDDPYQVRYVRAAMRSVEVVAREIAAGTDLVYEIRVEPAYRSGVANLSFGYYNVPSEAVPYILMNAIACIQRARTGLLT